jgi:hypothetical protein
MNNVIGSIGPSMIYITQKFVGVPPSEVVLPLPSLFVSQIIPKPEQIPLYEAFTLQELAYALIKKLWIVLKGLLRRNR